MGGWRDVKVALISKHWRGKKALPKEWADREWLAVDSLLRYLESHRERMNDCERLWEGRVIGSGQVEGALALSPDDLVCRALQ